MSYLSTAHHDALAVTPQELRSLPVETRAQLILRHHEIEAARRDRFWTAVQAIATGVIPILVFLGVTRNR